MNWHVGYTSFLDVYGSSFYSLFMPVVQDIDYDEFESIIFGEETTETYEVQISDIEVRDCNYYYPGIWYYNCVKWHTSITRLILICCGVQTMNIITFLYFLYENPIQ